MSKVFPLSLAHCFMVLISLPNGKSDLGIFKIYCTFIIYLSFCSGL